MERVRNETEAEEYRRMFKAENARANALAECIRECPEALSLWGTKLADEAAPHMTDHSRSAVIMEIAEERRRQVEVKGWTAEHDDGHRRGELAFAPACYAVGRMIVQASTRFSERFLHQSLWPWGTALWKPKERRRDLIKAAALIVAEIERLDRAALEASSDGGLD